MAKYSCLINKVLNNKKPTNLCSDIKAEDLELENKDKVKSGEQREILSISSKTLIPGDVFEIPEENFTMPCDAILVSGKIL